jgi:O-antigen ligase
MTFFNIIKNSSLSEKIIFLSVFIFTISLVSGPFLPDAFVSLIAIFFFYFFIKNFKFFIENKVIKIFILFYIYIVSSSFFSEVPIESLKTSIFYIRFLIFVIAINVLFKNIKFQYIFFYSFIFLYTALFFDSLYQINFGYNIFGLIKDTDRVSSFFGKELILGSFISKTIPIILYLLFSLQIKNKFFLYLYLICISFFIVLVSSERTSLFVYLVIIFFSLLFLKKKEILFTFLAALFSIFLSLTFYAKTFDRLYSHTLNQMLNKNNFYLFSYRHQLHFLAAFKIFEDHKFIGSGVKSFRYLCSDDKYSLRDKINKDNIFYAKENGKIVYIYNYITDQIVYLIINDTLNNDNNLFYHSLSQNFHSIHYHYLINLDRYSISNFIYRHPLQEGTFLTRVNNGQEIKKDQPIYSWYEYSNGCNTHPHNFYIQFLSELGAIGFLIFFYFYLYFFYKLLKLLSSFKKKIHPQFILYAGYVGVLFPLTPSGNFFNNYLSLLLILPLCLFRLYSLK